MTLKSIATVHVPFCICPCIKSTLVEEYSGKPAICFFACHNLAAEAFTAGRILLLTSLDYINALLTGTPHAQGILSKSLINMVSATIRFSTR